MLPQQGLEQEGGWRQAPGRPSAEQEGSSSPTPGTEGLVMPVSRGERVPAPGRPGPCSGTPPSAAAPHRSSHLTLRQAPRPSAGGEANVPGMGLSLLSSRGLAQPPGGADPAQQGRGTDTGAMEPQPGERPCLTRGAQTRDCRPPTGKLFIKKKKRPEENPSGEPPRQQDCKERTVRPLPTRPAPGFRS